MFPPDKTDKPEKWVAGLWESLQRAGWHFGQDIRMEPEGDLARVLFHLQEPLPKRAMSHIKKYIRGYTEVSGWSVKSLQVYPRYVLLIVSKGAGGW